MPTSQTTGDAHIESLKIGPDDPRYLATVEKRFNKRFRASPDYVRLVGSTADVVSASVVVATGETSDPNREFWWAHTAAGNRRGYSWLHRSRGSVPEPLRGTLAHAVLPGQLLPAPAADQGAQPAERAPARAVRAGRLFPWSLSALIARWRIYANYRFRPK